MSTYIRFTTTGKSSIVCAVSHTCLSADRFRLCPAVRGADAHIKTSFYQKLVLSIYLMGGYWSTPMNGMHFEWANMDEQSRGFGAIIDIDSFEDDGRDLM